MSDFSLEFRLSKEHPIRGLIGMKNVEFQSYNRNWSYARHLPNNWDLDKIERRKSVPIRLLDNLNRLDSNQEIDLSPLKDDQRISGEFCGKQNALQDMFELIQVYAKEYPKLEFYGKWGGGQRNRKGVGFAIYVDNEEKAKKTKQIFVKLAKNMNMKIDAHHRFGIVEYQEHVTIDERLKSKIRNIESFKYFLESLIGFPHFYHELFQN